MAMGAVLPWCAQAAPVAGQGSWESTLMARDLNGDGVADAYYDTQLNISWLADVMFLQPGGPPYVGYKWNTAMTRASQLDVYGIKGWRLPTVTFSGPDGSFASQFANNGSTDQGTARTGVGWGQRSELGHLFYVTLGRAGYDIPNDSDPAAIGGPQGGWVLDGNSGPFRHVFPVNYWTQTEDPYSYGGAPRPGGALVMDFAYGRQGVYDKGMDAGAWFVRDGDVGAVPEAQTVALALSGLGVMTWRRRGSRPFKRA
ncbi:MAG: hypothetical protein ACM3VZ_16500 [Acidobacteriota bacterium]